MVGDDLLVFAHWPHPFMETTLPSSQVGVGRSPALDDDSSRHAAASLFNFNLFNTIMQISSCLSYR